MFRASTVPDPRSVLSRLNHPPYIAAPASPKAARAPIAIALRFIELLLSRSLRHSRRPQLAETSLSTAGQTRSVCAPPAPPRPSPTTTAASENRLPQHVRDLSRRQVAPHLASFLSHLDHFRHQFMPALLLCPDQFAHRRFR